MESKTIKDFLVGDDIEGYFLIRAMNIKTSANNKTYLDMTLMDATGEINAKKWDISNDAIEEYQTGDIIKIRGNVTSWQNVNQFKITKMRKKNDQDQIEIDNLVQSAPINNLVMLGEVKSYIEKIENTDIKSLVNEIVSEYEEKFLYYPAAKSNHHAIRAGLLYHVLRMLRTGESICGVYDNLNADLVYAGVILHDIEKINEMQSDELGIVSTYTFDGQLLGHIIMGIKKIDEVAKRLGIDPEISSVLQHMILSHHYEAEYGSPKKPLIPEGEILHYLDMVDARMYDMTKALENTEEAEFANPSFVLDYRRLYKTKFDR